MANIILPEVDISNSINSNTKVLIEQNGEIKRLDISLLNNDGSSENLSNATTLEGHPASYFATASSVSSLQTSNASAHATYEGYFQQMGTALDNNDTDHTTYEGFFEQIGEGFNDLYAKVDALTNNKVLLYNVPSNGSMEEASFSLSRTVLETYEYLEFSAWTYIKDIGWWYEPVRRIRVDEFLTMMDDEVAYIWWVSLTGDDVYMRAIDYDNNTFYMSNGFWNGNYEYLDSTVLVIERIWGIKPTMR